MNKYTFFWSGPFSQWYKSDMVIDGVKFNCCEQYMMYRKALLFDDKEAITKIMKADDPYKQKRLGREVKNFNQKEWDEIARDVVYKANYAKFTQNEALKWKLINTFGTILVEASPFDKIWGIGLDEETASKTPEDEWPGTNWLGIEITKVRKQLFGN